MHRRGAASPEMPESLPELRAQIWQELQACVQDRNHGWRVATLATLNGQEPDARVVVLREVDEPSRELVFYTDARSPKVAQIRARSQGLLLCWCASLSWQLRLRVRLEVETDGLEVSSRWARLKLSPAAQDYLSPLPPGSVIGGAHGTHGTPPAPDRGSRGHFALVRARVESIDWTGLRGGGHRRAQFDVQGGRWLTP